MKFYLLFLAALLNINTMAQPQPHGMVYGSKPNLTGMLPSTKLDAFMGKRTRISVAISGRVTQVTEAKGGWFDLDAGNGRIITAHFKNYHINLPLNLKNHYVLIEGVAQKKFLADDRQHFAGDNDSKLHNMKPNPKQVMLFEVTGLVVDK